MKQKYILLSYLHLLLVSTNVSAIDIGETAPNWQLQNGYGESVDFYQDSSNKVSVLIYWATWCPYSASLMPHIQEVANEYEDNDHVVFYAMNIFGSNICDN